MPTPAEWLADLAVFAEVARTGGFTAAAGKLGVSKSAASKAVARLEARLGARLLSRTTRRLALTEAGRALQEHALRALAEAEAGQREVEALASSPLGTVRVNGPVSFGELFLAPAIPDLLARYPGLRVDLTLEDRLVDAATSGYDVVVRIAPLADSALAVRKLARNRRMVVASPAYLKKRGAPARPEDLAGHECLHYTNLSRAEEWRFKGPRGPYAVPATGSFESSSGAALAAAAVGGLGIAILPEFMAAPDVKAGRLVPLLEPFLPPPLGVIQALYAPGRPTPPKVRAFVDHLAARLKEAGLPPA